MVVAGVTRLSWWPLSCLMLASAACTGDGASAPADAGRDAVADRRDDGGPPADGAPDDGGATRDARPVDAEVPDAGRPDGTMPDAPDAGAGDAGPPGALPECPRFADGTETGRLPLTLREVSGIAESRRNPGVLWVHEDSGSDPKVYALSSSGGLTGGLLGTYALSGAEARDWEDIAVGPGPDPGVTYLYVGDIGDNGESRDDVSVYRVPEPAVSTGSAPVTTTLTGVERITLEYPDEAHNAETLLVDPRTGDLFIVVKSGGDSEVFRAAAPLGAGSPITMELVATLTFGAAPLEGDEHTTGGDISPSGDAIAIRTYDSAFLWRRAPGATIADALTTDPCPIPQRSEGQGEALGFAADGGGYYTVSEGSWVPVSFYRRR